MGVRIVGILPFRLIEPVSIALVVTALVGCSIGAKPTTTPQQSAEPALPSTTQWSSPSRAASDTSPPTPTPEPDETATSIATPDPDAKGHEQAHAALRYWDQVLQETGPNPIVFTSSLTRGGGWRGRDAGDKKSAFLCGLLTAVNSLPDRPPPRDVVWHDGTRRAVELVSAETAIDDIAERGGDWCSGERSLEVTGARLKTREIATTRGPAAVPVWELVFAERDEPLDPVTHPALDETEYITLEDWPALDHAVNTDWAVGRPESTDLTIAFTGAKEGEGPCTADYTGEPVESDTGVVVIVTGHLDLPSPRPTGPIVCTAEGHTRTVTVTLSEPLGNRTVLDHWSGWPVALFPEMPNTYPSI